jgi:hypothetical protein
MRVFLFLTALFFLTSTTRGQDRDFPTIDELGWQITDLSEPPDLKDTDIGAANYLVTLNENGKVKKIEVLTSTFSRKLEKLWKKQIVAGRFIRLRDLPAKEKEYRGTLVVTREMCNKDPDNQ